MANICWTKCDIHNRVRALESRNGLLRCRKILWTLVNKRPKTGPEFLPTLTISFCTSPSHTLCAALSGEVVEKPNKCKSFWHPFFRDRRPQLFYDRLLARPTVHRLTHVWLSSVCWSPSAKPGKWQWSGMRNLRRVGKTTVQFEAVCGPKSMSF